MKKKTKTIIATILLFIILSLLPGCNNIITTPPSGVVQAVHALPIAPSNGKLNVLDSYTDDSERNHYLIDSGSVDKLYLSTLASLYYDGKPTSLKVLSGMNTTVSSSVSNTISHLYSFESISSSNSSHKVTVGLGNKDSDISVDYSMSISTSSSWSKANTYSKSTTNTRSYVEYFGRQAEVEYKFGKNDRANGYYRYAIFAKCDLYFEVETSKNNDTLYDVRIISCVRESDVFIWLQFSEDGEFDNSSEQNLMLADNFYKDLPVPENKNSGDDDSKVPEFKVLYPTNQQSATVKDTTQNAYFKFDMTETADIMNTYNLAIRRIDIFVHIKEKDNGYQELYLIQQNNPNYGWRDNTHVFDDEITLFKKQDIETAPGKKGEGDYSVYQNVFIKRGDLCDSWFLYCGAHGDGGDTWEASNVSIIIYFEQL